MLKSQRIRSGEAIVVSNADLQDLEAALSNDEWCNLKTAVHIGRVGILDQWVAWLGDKGNPPSFAQKSHPDCILIAYAEPGMCA